MPQIPILTPVDPKDRDPKTVFVGVPIRGDACWDLVRLLTALEIDPPAGLNFIVRKVPDQPHSKARNLLSFYARCTPASRMMMFDSDITPSMLNVVRLATLDADVVGALVPKRQFDPPEWIGEFYHYDNSSPHPEGLWPMQSVGSPAISIRMSVFDRLIERPEVEAYESDEESPSCGLVRGQIMHDFWPMGVYTDDWFGRRYPRYLTEDYAFSLFCRRAGIKLWCDTASRIAHFGRMDFLRSMEANERVPKPVNG